MNGENLLKGLGGIDERFVAEAMSVGSDGKRIPFGAEAERRRGISASRSRRALPPRS